MYITEKDIEFAKSTFSNFVNGEMGSPKTVAAQMSLDHRYLQNEMFKICMEYVRVLAMNYQHGRYDVRNQWACQIANEIVTTCPNIPDLTECEWEDYQERVNAIFFK